MQFNYETRITFNDLSFDKQEEIRNAIAESIRDDVDLMKELVEREKADWDDSSEEFKLKLPFKRYIDLEVDELAMDNENRFKEYLVINFDISL